MDRILKSIRLIEGRIKGWVVPSVTKISRRHDPYRVLVSCILSLRTKDKTTIEASNRLFKVADDPRSMLKLNENRIRKLIYPVGFYRNKSRVILGLSRKTANLVLGLGFGIPAICVDTHVHRISNRLGWVKTRTPEQSEYALREIIPRREWIKLNTTLVTFGQNLCLPVSPFCSKCDVYKFCERRGVNKSR